RTQDAQRATRATARLDLGVEAGAVADRADPIAVHRRGPGDERGEARGLDRLEACARAEMHARVVRYDQQHVAFALFLEQLGVWPSGARGDAPVHLADAV